MPDFSLDELAVGRRGVRVEDVELRRTSPIVPPEMIEDSGLPSMVSGRAFGLPATVKPGVTLMHARIGRADEQMTWYAVYERAPDAEPPAEIVKRSTEVGGMGGLQSKLGTLWTTVAEAAAVLIVQYSLTGWRTKLLSSKARPTGHMMAKQTGAYWNIKGAEMLVGISIVREPAGKDLTVTALGQFEATGWPNLSAHEARLWQDLEGVLGGE